MTDRELDQRAIEASRISTSVPSTRDRYRPDGQWDPQRLEMHRRILDRVYARYAHIPAERRALMAGGLPGAGKTTVLGPRIDQFMPIDPDMFKEELIAEGGLPDVPGAEHLSPMELATVIHMESSWLADQLLRRAVADGRNVIVDATMGSEAAPRLRAGILREAGYSIDAVFVEVDIDTSIERVMARYRRGMRQWAAGEGPGGRPVPPAFIEQSRPATPGGPTANRQVFETLAAEGLFDHWEMYDNSGGAHWLIAKSRG